VDDTSIVFDITSNVQNEYSFTQTTIGESDFIEFITLSLELDHSVINDIGVTLTSPSGTTLRVITPYSAATLNPSNNSFDIGISGFYGEPMTGDWVLSITDYSDDSIGGTLKSFTLKTFGN
jgi:subtilisin-like proprotein convertase family protein